MKTRIVMALICAASTWAACAQDAAPKASVQLCDEAMHEFAVARKTSVNAAAESEKQVLKACYTGSGRAPVVRAPISV